MDVKTIIVLALGAYLIISGLVTLIRGKMMNGDYSKYTEKSAKAFARVFGACATVAGLLFIPYWVIGYINGNMSKITTSRLIFLAAAFTVIILALILRPIVLKKKDSVPKTTYQKSTDEDDV